MERIPARRCSSFFAVLVAVAFFVAGKTSLAQTASSGTSSQPQEFSQNVKEVYFPFNVYKKIINPAVLDQDAEWLKQHSDTNFWIQGYADIRGDIFYNLVLSYRRAQFVKTSLVKRGVSESQIGFATGWGKLYPVCAETKSNSECDQKNRYVNMVLPELLHLM